MFLLIGALTLLFLLTLLLLPAVVRDRARPARSAGDDESAAPNALDIPGAEDPELARSLNSDPGFAEQAREFRRSGKLVLPAINFRPNEASIERPSPALRRHLKLVRAIFAERAAAQDSPDQAHAPTGSGPTVLISGHTDRQGGRDHNLALSLSRAQAVAELLRDEYRLPPEAIRAVGRGFSEPIADNNSSEGRQRNRRVEIQLESV